LKENFGPANFIQKEFEMLTPRRIVRMAKWARHPTSLKMVILVFSIVAIGLLIAGIEHYAGWPEALTVDPKGHGKVRITQPIKP
jgi:hypothetical protein